MKKITAFITMVLMAVSILLTGCGTKAAGNSTIKSKADLKGKVVGIQLGSSSEEALNADENTVKSLKEVRKYENNTEALLDLKNGNIDAVVVDEVVGRYYISKKPDDYEVLEDNFGDEEYGVGIRSEDTEVKNALDKVLNDMKADGTADKISEKWFGKSIVVKDNGGQSSNASIDGDLNGIKQKGKLVVGLDDSFPPMGFRDEKGEIVGFDIDLAKEAAKRLGVQVEFKPVDWDGVLLSLKNKDIDVIWNGLTITEERKKQITFSNVYLKNRQIIVVKKSSK
jgi:ABC-type amino acid transport substrate-binding protein